MQRDETIQTKHVPQGYKVKTGRRPDIFGFVHVGDEVIVDHFMAASGDEGNPMFLEGTIDSFQQTESGTLTGIAWLRNWTTYHEEGGPRGPRFKTKIQVNLNPEDTQTSTVNKLVSTTDQKDQRAKKALAQTNPGFGKPVGS